MTSSHTSHQHTKRLNQVHHQQKSIPTLVLLNMANLNRDNWKMYITQWVLSILFVRSSFDISLAIEQFFAWLFLRGHQEMTDLMPFGRLTKTI